ncbi:MmcQ/YjbR family DNA-binding protein [Corynebacterium suedekumii]|uniref:MmcQ/YjbR family DNA-binding protein n=1 Tax=Corynebacterium suedekumii TaxID=3049801 RepID=A0ABY8VT67_9CORY|nr:MmcQ/YjbR family DNA-binding protein [Corynebacterium suedekumii]WIM70760.1 MmcQ/YjbR family DNA-binding protein [Corynebacterium suedekumii]
MPLLPLFDAARSRAAELPGTDKTFPFDGHNADVEVWKVRGKMFAMLTRGVVTLKADPFEAEMLRHTHAWITPGWHMNKRHWISVADGVLNAEGAGNQFLADLVTDSYLLVVAGLPRAQRPVDPATFGRG